MEVTTTTTDDDKEEEEEEEEESGGGEVYMDPVVYWTSSKDRLGMEELLFSMENSMLAVEEDYGDDEPNDNEGGGDHSVESEEGLR